MFETTMSELSGAVFQLLLFSSIPFLWWLIGSRKKLYFFKWIGLYRPEWTKPLGNTIGISAAAVLLYIALSAISLNCLPDGITLAGSQFSGLGYKKILAAFLYGFVRTGLSEEILFRGFLLKRVSSRFGFAAGNTIQALCFGLLHGIPFGMLTGSIPVVIVMPLLPGGFGWFQGWLNEKRFGGSIVPSWLIHGTMNTLTTLLTL